MYNMYLVPLQSNMFNDCFHCFLGIYGGHNAAEGRHPYIVTLAARRGLGDRHLDAGSIINKRWILSCSDCISK